MDIRRFFILQICTRILLLASFAPLSYAQAELALPDLNNKLVKVSDFKGKWVIVNYWATWCPSCVEEIPELNAFHKKHHMNNAVVLGVNIEKDDLEYVKEFVRDFKIIYPILISADGVSSPYGHLQAVPTTFILDKQGKLIKTIVGIVTMESLEKIITQK